MEAKKAPETQTMPDIETVENSADNSNVILAEQPRAAYGKVGKIATLL